MLSKESEQSLFLPVSKNHPEFFTMRIDDRTKFNRLLPKYPKSMKIVSCWHSIELILEWVEKVEYLEIVVGDSLVNGYKKQLHQKLNEFEKLYQLQKDSLLLDSISYRGNRENSLFMDEKGHQGDIIINAGALMWLESIYSVDLDENDYETGFNTDLHSIAQDILDSYNQN